VTGWVVHSLSRSGGARPRIRVGAAVNDWGRAKALPRMRLRFVPQTGHTPFAMRVPLSLTLTSPSASRFSLHLTQ
jgi:hypothetical protein